MLSPPPTLLGSILLQSVMLALAMVVSTVLHVVCGMVLRLRVLDQPLRQEQPARGQCQPTGSATEHRTSATHGPHPRQALAATLAIILRFFAYDKHADPLDGHDTLRTAHLTKGNLMSQNTDQVHESGRDSPRMESPDVWQTPP